MLRDTELAGLARTLGKDTNLTITVGGDNSYCSSDGNRINIARMPATPLGRMLMTGLVFHEVGHKKYTRGDRPQGLLGDLVNIIEDVRVEALTIQERPGTGFDLEAVTSYYAQKGELTPTDTTTALLGLVLAYGYGEVLHHQAVKELLTTSRTMLEAELGSTFVADLLQLLERDFPALSSTMDSQSLAQRIIERLKQVPQEKESSAPQEDGESAAGTSDGFGEGTAADSSTGNQQDQQQQKSEHLPGASTEGDLLPEGQQQKSHSTPDTRSEADSSSDQPQTTPTPPKLTDGDIEQMITSGCSYYGDRSSAIIKDLDQMAAETPQEVLHAIPTLPATQRVTNPDRFAEPLDQSEALVTSSRLRSRMLILLQGKQRRTHAGGCTGRRIDQRRLVQMAFGDPKIFRKKEEIKALNTAVVILVDGSGSMISTGGGSKTLSSVANASAYALHTALYHLTGVKVATAVFAGRENFNINTVADFGEKPVASLFQVRPNGSTPTDQGLWYARAALLARPESRKIILLVTDGRPDDASDTRAATRNRQLRPSCQEFSPGAFS